MRARANAEMYLAEILAQGMGDVPYIADISVSVTTVMTEPSRVTCAILAQDEAQ